MVHNLEVYIARLERLMYYSYYPDLNYLKIWLIQKEKWAIVLFKKIAYRKSSTVNNF